jgi:hypothetical protein
MVPFPVIDCFSGSVVRNLIRCGLQLPERNPLRNNTLFAWKT